MLAPNIALRLRFLARVVSKEARHLASTDKRLFCTPLTVERAGRLESDLDLAEQVDAFVARFSRLQDTLGDKLLPLLLAALGETPGPVIDNLDRAERLGLIASADTWMTARNLRNQMVHEYVEDIVVLTSALHTGHTFVTALTDTASRFVAEIERRGWA